MKQYDKIWVPSADVSDWEVRVRPLDEKTKASYKQFVKREEKVIVLTVEELRQVWDAGHERAANRGVIRKEDGRLEYERPDFKTFCKSKGINIE